MLYVLLPGEEAAALYGFLTQEHDVRLVRLYRLRVVESPVRQNLVRQIVNLVRLFEDGMLSDLRNLVEQLILLPVVLHGLYLLVASRVKLWGVEDLGGSLSTFFVFEESENDTVCHEVEADELLVKYVKAVDFETRALLVDVYQLNHLIPSNAKIGTVFSRWLGVRPKPQSIYGTSCFFENLGR